MSTAKSNELDSARNQLAETQTNNAADFLATTATIGAFATRRDTVVAEVLARLIKGENLTSLDAVYDCNTTRLAATINYLGEKYNWHIARVDIDVGTDDGRVTVVTVYYLDRAVIRKAFDSGAMEFCRSVKDARAKTRKLAPKAKEKAAKRNAARVAKQFNPNQGSLFGGAT